MPHVNMFRVRRGWFGTSILQQYFDGSALSLPYSTSGWVDVAYENAPASLKMAKRIDTVDYVPQSCTTEKCVHG